MLTNKQKIIIASLGFIVFFGIGVVSFQLFHLINVPVIVAGLARK